MNTQTVKKLAIFGAGIGNLALLKELERQEHNFEITLVDPKDYVEIPFSMIRSLLENDTLGAISRTLIKDAFKNIHHIQGTLKTLSTSSAIVLDTEGQEQEIEFDYAAVATGAHSRGFQEIGVSYVDSLEKRNALWNKRGEEIADAKHIIIAGGGVIGVEIAGEIVDRYPEKTITIISGSERLLAHMSESASKKALKVLKKRGKNLQVHFNDRVVYKEGMDSHNTKEVTTESGKTYSGDMVFLTLGNEYHSEYMKEHFSHVLTSNQRIQVNPFLQIEGNEHIFVFGDIANICKTTLGHLALDQGVLTAHNLIKQAQGQALSEFELGNKEKQEFITLGKKAGIAQLPFGRMDFMIKVKQKDFFAPKILEMGKAR